MYMSLFCKEREELLWTQVSSHLDEELEVENLETDFFKAIHILLSSRKF